MSNYFRHHPDGLIYLAEACYPLKWFVVQEPAYSLPPGAIGRGYIPGIRHSLYSADSQWGGELPWSEGELYLSKASEYAALWQAANQPELEPEPEPEPEPGWAEFRRQIIGQAEYFRLVTGHPQNFVLNTLLVQLLFGVGTNPSLLLEVVQVWNTMQSNVPLTALEITQLNAVAGECAVPMWLDEQGRMKAAQ